MTLSSGDDIFVMILHIHKQPQQHNPFLACISLMTEVQPPLLQEEVYDWGYWSIFPFLSTHILN